MTLISKLPKEIRELAEKRREEYIESAPTYKISPAALYKID